MKEIDSLTFETAPSETVSVTSANQIVLTLNGAQTTSPVPAPKAGQSSLGVTVFFRPGDGDATVTFTGSLGGSFDRSFHKPANDDFQGKNFTLKAN